jgi:hypothetical protein
VTYVIVIMTLFNFLNFKKDVMSHSISSSISSVESNVAFIPPLNFVKPENLVPDVDNMSSMTGASSENLRRIRRARKSRETRRYNDPGRHATVMSSREIPVDSNIVELIEALWDCGFETQFSCEGDVEGFDSSNTLDNGQWGAHVVFPNLIHAGEFLETSYNHLTNFHPEFAWHSVMSLRPMMAHDYPAHVRAIVVFNPAALPVLTEFWSQLALESN